MGLKLKIVPQNTLIDGVMNWDGYDDNILLGQNVYPQLPWMVPDMSGNKTIKFSMWLDTSIYTEHSSFGAGIVDWAVEDSSDYFAATLYNSQMRFYCGVPGNTYIDINNSHINKILNIEVGKSTNVADGSINYVKINGVEQSFNYLSGLGRGGTQSDIGRFSSAVLYSAAVWDIKISDTDTEALEHYWKGYPNGNTNTAWEDLVDASFNGFINGDPSTRNIVGGPSGGSTISMTNKLTIIEESSDLTGVADFNDKSVTILSTDSADFGTEYKIYRWKMWLDNDSGYSNTLFRLPTPASIDLNALLIDSSIYFATGAYNTTFSIAGLDDQILDCVLYTGYTAPYITNFEINGSFVSPSEGIITSGTLSTVVAIGGGISVWDGNAIDDLDNATVWDWSVETSLGVLLHAYTGYPAGNTLTAWEDTVGSMDAVGKTVTGTRDITGGGTTSGGGSKLILEGIFIEQPILAFVTDASTDMFDPTFLGGGTLRWDLGDGSIVNANTFDHTYTILGNKNVKLYEGTTTGVTGINLFGDDLVGEIDISDFLLATSISLYNNPKLTNVQLPTTSTNVNTVYLMDCDLTGTIDASGMTGLGGSFRVDGNSNLTKLLLPETSNSFVQIILYNSDLTGELDLSPLSNLSGSILAYSNSNLTSLKLPDSPGNVTTFSFSRCDLTGTIDISAFTQITQINFEQNHNLTEVINPTTSSAITQYVVSDCSLSSVDISGLSNVGGVMYFNDNDGLTEIINPVSSATITTYNAYYCDLTGTLDVSGLTGLGGTFQAHNNANLTSVLLPTSSNSFSAFRLDSCNLTETLDASGLTNLGGNFQIQHNANLANILFPISSTIFTAFYTNDCGLTNTLDLSDLTGLGGTVYMGDNTSLEQILFPDSSQNITYFNITNCDLTGDLDISGLSNVYPTLLMGQNSNLSSITFPSTFTGAIVTLTISDCSLNQTTVDSVLSKLDTYFDSNEPTNSLNVSLNGGTNMPPTDGSSNSNITHLESIFSTAGETLIININE